MTPFVGRERELDIARSAVDDALDGRASVLLIGGGPGMGKTRLADELEATARARGAEVVWGRAWEARRILPLIWVLAIADRPMHYAICGAEAWIGQSVGPIGTASQLRSPGSCRLPMARPTLCGRAAHARTEGFDVPKFMDVHEGFVGITPEALAKAHAGDLAIQADEGVSFEHAWADPVTGKVFCISEAPNAEAVRRIHTRNGIPPAEIHELTMEV